LGEGIEGIDGSSGQPRASFKLLEISEQSTTRIGSGFGELDRVLGGGIVRGSLILIGGEPGIGKSTLLLQTANQLSHNCRVLYVSAEESGQQVKLRFQRIASPMAEKELNDRAEANGSSPAEENKANNSPSAEDKKANTSSPAEENKANTSPPSEDNKANTSPSPEPVQENATPNVAPEENSPVKQKQKKSKEAAKNVVEDGKAETKTTDRKEKKKKKEKEQPEGDRFEENLYLLPETDLEAILRELESLKPQLAVIDSIQTIYFASLTSAPGSVAQVRECTSALMQVAKRENITLFIVGHVTKDGSLAGPRVLEHLVDTVLYFEGDRFASHRLLRSMKNRFGATHEIGVFEMVAHGLKEVPNPSELFLGSRDEFCTGSSTIVSMEGTRPIVVELQALVSPASQGAPRRSTTGIDSSRLQQILAVLEKRVGIPLSKLDTFVATVGGLVVSEPAADLGVAIAIVASFRDRVIDPRTILIGEVGLSGQVRPVAQLELRLREAAKLGFKRAIIPKGQKPGDMGMHILSVGKVIDAILAAIPTLPATMGKKESTTEF
jgi:DNA repair protein RadA/Sms